MPATPHTTTPPNESKRVWEVVAIVIAAAALGCSVYSIKETHDVQEASKKAAEKSQAQKVDVYALANAQEGLRVFVANRSESAISSVKVEFRQGYWVSSHSIPGCNILKIPVIVKTANGGLVIRLGHPVLVYFTDVEGRRWVTLLEVDRIPNLKRDDEKRSLRSDLNLDKLLAPYSSVGSIPGGCG